MSNFKNPWEITDEQLKNPWEAGKGRSVLDRDIPPNTPPFERLFGDVFAKTIPKGRF